MPGGVRTEIHLTGDDTGGAFCLLVDHPRAGWSLPPHVHDDAAETIHVIEGDPWDPPRARREFRERFERLDAAGERIDPRRTTAADTTS
jgi:hypothetical protein